MESVNRSIQRVHFSSKLVMREAHLAEYPVEVRAGAKAECFQDERSLAVGFTKCGRTWSLTIRENVLKTLGAAAPWSGSVALLS
jgi:hypothetical protein